MKLLEFIGLINEDYEFLFELRNVLNVDDLKALAKEISFGQLSASFMNVDMRVVIAKWAQKALFRYMVENMPGTDYEIAGDGLVAKPVGTPDPQPVSGDFGVTSTGSALNLPLQDLPPWAQDALKRGEQLTWINWRDREATQEVNRQAVMVRDWLRRKDMDEDWNQNPNLMQRTLSRVNWAEAIRLSEVYHAELRAQQARIATIKDVLDWYEENRDEILAQVPDSPQKEAMTRAADTLTNYSSAGEAERITYGVFVSELGPQAAQGLIRAYEKHNKPKKVQKPEDDPEGLVPYLQYTQAGEKFAPDVDVIEPDDPRWQPAPEFGPQWVKLTTAKCAEYEGAMMGHCVGGYGKDIERGDTHIYSLRDPNNEPHVTIEVTGEPDGGFYTLAQIKGKQNAPPVEKWRRYVVDFLTKLSLGSEEGVEIDTGPLSATEDLHKMEWLADYGGLDIPGELGDLIRRNAYTFNALTFYKKNGMTKELAQGIVDYFDGEVEYDPKMKGFVIGEFKDVMEFVQDHLGDQAQHVMSALYGDDYVDMVSDYTALSADISDLIDSLPPEVRNQIQAYMEKKYGGSEEYEDIDFSDSREISNAISTEDDELENILQSAMSVGAESGAQQHMYEHFNDYLDELTDDVKLEVNFVLDRNEAWDKPCRLLIPERDMADLVQTDADMGRIEGDSPMDHMDIKDYEEPNYGYRGFDEGYAKEAALERLPEIGIET